MTLNELQILLALNDNQRIEYAEEEIFTDVELYTCYLESICSKYNWFESYNKCEAGEVTWLAYRYATDMREGSWPAAECIIAKNPEWAYYYAKYVIVRRWPEAERTIATARVYAKQYNKDFGTKI